MLASRRREITQEKALHDRAKSLLLQAQRLENTDKHAEAAEAYEIAARLTSDPNIELEVRSKADLAERNHRRKRWQHILKKIIGFPVPVIKELGKDGT